MFIYELPIQEYQEVCRILDLNNRWHELGGVYMGFDQMALAYFKNEILRGQSPTNLLLTTWGQQNHTVLDLFTLLHKMQHYQAMTPLKKFVDKEYHILGTPLPVLKPMKCEKELNIPQENFDHNLILPNVNEVKIINKIEQISPTIKNKPQPQIISRENNESVVSNNSQLNQAVNNVTRRLSNCSLSSESATNRIPQIPYHELEDATNNWATNMILGKGGFGTVFKGIWKCTEVAIKRVEKRSESPESHDIQLKQSITELNCLNAYRHDNILPLYGYSLMGVYPCLVYQYMPGGCLDQRLHNRDPRKHLNWIKRLHIAKGTARGLQFLHTFIDKPLIHGDIKSANILLDLNDDPKIGDFGLAREGPHSDYTHIKVSRIHGTRPYLPDEFLRAKQVSTKVDTYSYGVVLFEIATGLSAYNDNRKDKFLKEYVVNYEGNIRELIDVRAGNERDTYFDDFINMGKLCVEKRPKDRPEMKFVYQCLDKL